MLTLTLDASGPCAGVAVTQDGALLYESLIEYKLTHSESLLPMAREALTRLGRDIEEITHIAAVVGPGSYTGVRIGVCCARGIAHARGIPCIAVDALEALAFGHSGLVCPLRDARARQVYGCLFKNGNRITEDAALSLDEMLSLIRDTGDDSPLFTGDGARAHLDELREAFPRGRFLPPQLMSLRPAAAAALAWRDIGKAGDYLSLQPLYLRPPQAERERSARA